MGGISKKNKIVVYMHMINEVLSQKFHPHSILTGKSQVEFLIYCVLIFSFYILGSGLSNLKSLLKYMCPVILFSVLFNLPKFFEYHLDEMEYFNVENNRTEIHLKLTPTELRLNANYVFYYINLSRFVVSGLFPFISLTFLHLAIYR